MRKIYLLLLSMVLSFGLFAQGGNLKGKVVNEENNETLPGATVIVKGTSVGAVTNFDGNFSLKSPSNTGTLVVSFVGYVSKAIPFNVNDKSDLGTISLSPDATSLEGVEIVGRGILDVATERKTPVAVSTIRAKEIANKLGNQEFPEILKTTPSVYATKQGGGFGDARINIRGFNQRNTAIMINGVPVNDMENGWVYWSNWAGLQDVASGMQVQRGLGASKLAISSIGGTINIITKATERKAGGLIKGTVGNDGYYKGTASYSSGIGENGWGVTALFTNWQGNGYALGTEGAGQNYFLSFGKKFNENNQINFTLTGAPQWHNQRTTSFFNMATLDDYLVLGKKYNYNYGTYNGESFNWRKNFYHKPIASLNWDLNFSDKVSLSTVLYGSWGRGGGTGDIGRLPGYKYASSSIFRDNETGEVLYDDIAKYNMGEAVVFSDGESYQRDDIVDGKYYNDAKDNGLTRRSSMNSHNWYGAIVNLAFEMNDNWTFDIGVDSRIYKGYHYRRLTDLLGADGYFDYDNINEGESGVLFTQTYEAKPEWNVFANIDDEEKIDYYNIGNVTWDGIFSQIEYSTDVVSAFLQAGVSVQGFQRIDYFQYEDSDPKQATGFENLMGGNIKGGVNFNLDDYNNIFVNVGYYSKQPLFDGVWINFDNILNNDLKNETIIGVEAGYGFRSSEFKANINVYRTSWKDRFIDIGYTNVETGDRGVANIPGVEQIHTGLEVDMRYNPMGSNLAVYGMLSLGNWEYAGSPTGKAFDEDLKDIGDVTLYLDGVKVGDAAQFTSMIGADYNITKCLSIDARMNLVSKLYARINAEDFGDENHLGSLQLPSFALFDAGAGYDLKIGNKSSLYFRLNVNNVFDTEYLSESITNYHGGSNTWHGINNSNKVFFGFGRTWNTSVTFRF